jgi:hypothetical protein
VAPTQAQLDTRLGAEWRRPWPGPDPVTLTAPDTAWDALASIEPPVLYTRSGEVTRLHAGGGDWTLAGSHLTLTTAPTQTQGTVSLMNGWWRGSRRGEQRGFCPAVLIRAGK